MEAKLTKDFINTALEIVTGDRQKNHGDKIKNHCNIGSLWSAYLGREITARDVALMMALLKIARTKTGSHNSDDYVDGIGYMAIAGEISEDNADTEPQQLKLF
tara:strand:+ start:979 stop:1287 length:309 start_codon:yes stop_codon:yes gene_type:complete